MKCSECDAEVTQPARGRKRDTCGAKCAQARHTRRIREREAYERASRKAAAENERYLAEDFRPWARGEKTTAIGSTEVKP